MCVCVYMFAALFQWLLFEAVGRAINPVSGAVGLLWTGNWNLCQSAVQTVLQGGTLQPLPEFSGGVSGSDFEDVGETVGVGGGGSGGPCLQSGGFGDVVKCKESDLNLCLMIGDDDRAVKRRRESTSSEESETTTLVCRFSGDGNSSNDSGGGDGERKLLRLFI